MTSIEQSAATPTVVPAQRPAPEAQPRRSAPAVSAAAVAAPPRRGRVATVLAGLVCGVLGLLVAPVLLGPAAIVGGLAGEHLGRRGSRRAAAAVLLALTVAALVAALVLR